MCLMSMFTSTTRPLLPLRVPSHRRWAYQKTVSISMVEPSVLVTHLVQAAALPHHDAGRHATSQCDLGHRHPLLGWWQRRRHVCPSTSVNAQLSPSKLSTFSGGRPMTALPLMTRIGRSRVRGLARKNDTILSCPLREAMASAPASFFRTTPSR